MTLLERLGRAIRWSERAIRRVMPLAILVAIAGVSWVAYDALSGTRRHSRQPRINLRVRIIDYTVPFDNYREHSGVVWLLNHLKVSVPRGAAWWLAKHHYTGYRPSDREHPQRLHQQPLDPVHLLYISDTYGVYQGDLNDIPKQQAHMDYSPLVFGGLDHADANSLHRYVVRGGLLVAEFNTICDPTPDDVRAKMERTLGVTWSGWVGRVFAKPRDTNDVPHWFPRQFEKQFPGQDFPNTPILLLVGRGGQMHIVEGRSTSEVAPRISLTALGQERFPSASGGAPYYYWFGLMKAQPEAIVHAQFDLPQNAELSALLKENDLAAHPPALIENSYGRGRSIYMAGDFGEPDFVLGRFDDVNTIENRADAVKVFGGVSQAPLFWLFYAPFMSDLIREFGAARKRPR